MGRGITSHRIRRLEDRLDTAESDIDTLGVGGSGDAVPMEGFRATLSSSFAPNNYTTPQIVDQWVEDEGDDAFTLDSNQDLVINTAGRYLVGYCARILANSPYSATYFQTLLYHTPISTGTPGLIDSMSVNTEIDGNVIARGNGAGQQTIITLAAGDIIDLRCRDGVATYKHQLETNGTTLWAVSLSASGGSSTDYKITTMPATSDANGLVVYTGFATDLSALTSQAKWAVKEQLEAGTETWAGKTTFDEILDDYLTLTYT